MVAALAAFEEELAERLGRLRPLVDHLPDNAMGTHPKMVHDLFRELHSLKGAANLLGFHLLGGIAHRLEDLLTKVRDREVKVDGAVRSALRTGVDQIERLGESFYGQEEDDGEGLAQGDEPP